jgi:hypothetical protein
MADFYFISRTIRQSTIKKTFFETDKTGLRRFINATANHKELDPLLASKGKDSYCRQLDTGRKRTVWDDREVAIIPVLVKKDGGLGVEIILTSAEKS